MAFNFDKFESEFKILCKQNYAYMQQRLYAQKIAYMHKTYCIKPK